MLLFAPKEVPVQKTQKLLLVFPVILTFIVCKKNIHICGILCDRIFADRLFPYRVDDASRRSLPCRRLIEPAQEKDHKRHIICQGNLSCHSIAIPQFSAETTVKRTIQVKILEFNLRFIHYHITKHKTSGCILISDRIQLFLINFVWHFGQSISILPFPLGIRIFCLQFGQE